MVRRLPLALSWLLVAAGPAGVAAEEPAGVAALFPRRAAVGAPAGRLVRLELPPEVLAACRPDLSDLRLLDSREREVPFLVLEGLAPEEGVEMRAVFRPELLAAERQTVESVPGREGGPELRWERYVVAAPPEPPEGERWELVVETGRRELVRRVEVAAAGDGEGGGRAIAEGSVFRLADPPRERLRVPLPPLRGELAPARLAVTLEGEGEEFLEPVLRFERVRELPGGERARVPLALIEIESSGGRSVLVLERPRGLVPDRLAIETATPAFDRRVEVWDEGPGAAGEALGRARVFRLSGPAGVEGLEIPLEPARGDRLRLVIHDGDSPPLAGLEVLAAIRRPALVFALPEADPAGDGTATASLYFGGGRAFPPRYDLQDLAPSLERPATGTAATVAERLYDPAALPAAELEAIRENPRFDPAPALAFALRPGSPLDVRRWRWRLPLAGRPSAEGLVRLRLGLPELARARGDLADLRIAGGDGRQWAYLIEAGNVREQKPLEVAGPESEDGVSRYRLVPPAAPATLDAVTLEVAAPFFDRPFTLETRRDDRVVVLARGRLVLPPRDPRPVEVHFPAARVEELTLAVEDGSDPPLEIARAEGWFPVPELYFAAPAGDYGLLVGNPEAEPPRYELSRVRDVVLAVSAGEAEAGELAENPGYRAGARWLAAPGLQRALLWGALLLAVAGLAFLTLRLARREGGEP